MGRPPLSNAAILTNEGGSERQSVGRISIRDRSFGSKAQYAIH